MSSTESSYGERFFDLEQSMFKQMDAENAQKQYNHAVSTKGETRTFEEWKEAGEFDKDNWDLY